MHILTQQLQAQSSKHICAACGKHDLSLYAKASKEGLGPTIDECDIKFYRCNICQSINEFSSIQEFYDLNNDVNFANFYLDVGAGIQEMIDPLARFSGLQRDGLSNNHQLSFLELGCGFGFVVDYCSSVLGWKSQGIEPGGYGRIGSQALGVSIDQQLLGQGSNADGNKYDCIYASEVLEHLQNPDHFLSLCHSHLAENGVLILTTPCAEYINQTNPPEEVYACLFPGEHKVIFSEKGLESALSRAGFSHFRLEKRRDNNWVILASPLHDVQPIYGSPELDKRANQQYCEYLHLFLDQKSTANAPQHQRVQLALLFRLIKFLVNQGDIGEATTVIRNWYITIGLYADPELKGLLAREQVPVDDVNLIRNVLKFCLIGMTRERIEVEIYKQNYPKSGAAIFKTLGFFVTMIVHNSEIGGDRRVLRDVLIFLEALIDYAQYARGCKTPFYHLELVSLITPATEAIALTKKKLKTDSYQFSNLLKSNIKKSLGSWIK